MRAVWLFLVVMQVSIVYGKDDEFRFLLQAIKHQRAEIRTGHFTGSGSFIDRSVNDGDLSGELKFTGYFDFDNHRLRFDWDEPYRVYSIDSKNAWTRGRRGGQLIRTEEQVILNPDMGQTVDICSPEKTNPEWCNPFDIRALGLCFWVDYANGVDFEKVWSNYAKFEDNQVSKGANGLVSVTTMITGGTRRILDIDTGRGYWPRKLVVQRRVRDARGNLAWVEPPELLSELEVKQVKEVWLPAKYTFKTTRVEQQVVINWKQVNSTIDPSMFTLEGLNVPSSKLAVDNTLGKPVVIKRLSPLADPDQPNRSSLRKWLIVCNLLVLGVLSLLFLRRFYRASGSA